MYAFAASTMCWRLGHSGVAEVPDRRPPGHDRAQHRLLEHALRLAILKRAGIDVAVTAAPRQQAPELVQPLALSSTDALAAERLVRCRDARLRAHVISSATSSIDETEYLESASACRNRARRRRRASRSRRDRRFAAKQRAAAILTGTPIARDPRQGVPDSCIAWLVVSRNSCIPREANLVQVCRRIGRASAARRPGSILAGSPPAPRCRRLSCVCTESGATSAVATRAACRHARAVRVRHHCWPARSRHRTSSTSIGAARSMRGRSRDARLTERCRQIDWRIFDLQ